MFLRITEGKKILLSKWNEHNKSMHHKNLKNIKGQVDTACPLSYGSLKRKPKKEQLMEERYTEIERENKILLNKMSQIVNSRPNLPSSSTRRKSLNIEARKRQNMRIVTENQALLKRLQGKQPSYSVYKWEEERKSTEKRLRNICEFPYTLGAYDETLRKSESRSGQGSRSRTIVRVSENTTKSSRKQSAKSQKKAQIVYRKGMSVGEKHYIVEIQKKHSLVVVLAFDIEKPESFCLEITNTQAKEIMGGDDNYSVLVNMLALENGELILVRNKENIQETYGFEIEGFNKKDEFEDLAKGFEGTLHKKSYTAFDGGNYMESWLGIGESDFRGGNVNELDKYSDNEDEEFVREKESKEEGGNFEGNVGGEVLQKLDEEIIVKNPNKVLESEEKVEKNSPNFFDDRGFEEKMVDDNFKKLFFEAKEKIDEFCSEEIVVENRTEMELGKEDLDSKEKLTNDVMEIEETKLRVSDSENEVIEKVNKNDIEIYRENESKGCDKSSSDNDLHTIKSTSSVKNTQEFIYSKIDDVNPTECQESLLKSQDSFQEQFKEEISAKNEENEEKLLGKAPETSGNSLIQIEKKSENNFEILGRISEKSSENIEKSSEKTLKNSENSEKSLKSAINNSVKSLEILDKSIPKKTTSLITPNSQIKDLFYNPNQIDSPLLIEEESKLKNPYKKSETEKEKASKPDSSDDENHILRKFESSSDEDYYSYSDSDESPYEVSERFVPKNNLYGKTEAKTPEIHSKNIRDSNPIIDFKSYPNSPFTNYNEKFNEFQGYSKPFLSENIEEKNKIDENIKKNDSKSNLKNQISEKSQDNENNIKILNQTENIKGPSEMTLNNTDQTKNNTKSKEFPYEKVKRVTIKDEKIPEIENPDKNKHKKLFDSDSKSSYEISDEGIVNDINQVEDLVNLNLEERTESLLDYISLGPIPQVIISMAEDPVPNSYTYKFSFNEKYDDPKADESSNPNTKN
ncbi:hypothetical protein SteCoe_19773 [Stentor coeruleus]|uniref:Uncharacterized protein n=1 Tax=Stentor coeruleus TaxID=5963 RepID=A0A1R2BTY9_9CILI|nr:hypothetical protein SteCoe_19773 [Stentor coeruleus]